MSKSNALINKRNKNCCSAVQLSSHVFGLPICLPAFVHTHMERPKSTVTANTVSVYYASFVNALELCFKTALIHPNYFSSFKK